MQAIHLNLNRIIKELEYLGLNERAIKRLTSHNITHAFKLRSIPDKIIPLLESEFSTQKTAVIFSHKSYRTSFGIDAVITGSKAELTYICKSLEEKSGEAASLGHILQSSLNKLYKQKPRELKLGRYLLPLGERTLIMGILNVTPDSFSDGGKFYRFESALAQAHKMAQDGADIIDIGGESTRPGSKKICAEDELKRIMPVITALKKDRSFKLPLSIDTYKAEVAENALDAGVEMLNDVWGLKADSAIGRVAARYGIPVCLMHNRRSTDYVDLIPDIFAELEESIALAHQAGIEDSRIIIDPGIGFGKNLQQNLEVMHHLQDFCNIGYPLLLGTSRKSMIGKTLKLPEEERIEGTAATVAYGISAGADIVRVHDVMQMHRVVVMTDAMIRR